MKATRSICIVTLLMNSAGYSQGTLDQFYAPTDATQCNVFALNFGGVSHGQTFTVGIAGYITRVDVFIGRNELQTAGDISWTLRSTISGTLVAGPAGVLASGTLPYGNLDVHYTYQSCLISPSLVPVAAGMILGITLSSDHMFAWAGHDASPYPLGSNQLASGPDGPWGPDTDFDLGFKTFVQPMPNPDARLSISQLRNASIQITWSTNFADHILEYATTFPASRWSSVTNTTTFTGHHLSVTVEAGASQRFYRLRDP